MNSSSKSERGAQKTNEQYIEDIKSGVIDLASLRKTPYRNIFVISEKHEEDTSYFDEDHDWIKRTSIVVDRETLIKIDDNNISFISEFWFDEIGGFSLIYFAIVRLGGLVNIITLDGVIVLPYWYKSIKSFGNNLLCCSKDSSCDIYDRLGTLKIENVSLEESEQGSLTIIKQSDNQWNYIDRDGVILLDNWVLEAQGFSQGYAFVRLDSGWGVINSKGEFVCNPVYKNIRKPSKEINSVKAIVGDDAGYNILMYINHSYVFGFENSVDLLYECGSYHRWFIVANKDGLWSYYKFNDKVNKIVSYQLLEIDKVVEPLVLLADNCYIKVQKGNQFNLIGEDGYFSNEWYEDLDVIGRVVKVKKGNSSSPYNLLNFKGQPLFEQGIPDLSVKAFDNVLVVNQGPKFNFNLEGRNDYPQLIKEMSISGLCNIIRWGEFISSQWFDGIILVNGKVINDGFIKVKKDGKCNIIDEMGLPVCKDWYDDIKKYKYINNSYEVVNDDKINYLVDGNLLFDKWFDRIDFISENSTQVRVRLDGKEGIYILGVGLLSDRLYQEIKEISDSLFFCYDSGVGYIINSKGEVIETGPFADVGPFEDGYATVFSIKIKNNNNWYNQNCHYKYNYINTNGRLVLTEWLDGNSSNQKSDSDYTIVQKDNLYNTLDRNKKLLFPVWYVYLKRSGSIWIAGVKDKGVTLLDFEGNRLINEWYDKIYTLDCLNDGVFVVKTKRGYNTIDIQGNYLLPRWFKNPIENNIYSHIYLSFAMSRIQESDERYSDKYYLINKEGQLALPYPVKYDSEEINHIYCITFDKDGGFDYDNPKNIHYYVYVIPVEIPGAGQPLMAFKEDGTLLFNRYYQNIEEFHNRKCRDTCFKVMDENGYYTILDRTGKQISESFRSIKDFDYDDDGYGYAVVYRGDDKYNLINENLEVISNLWFDELGYYRIDYNKGEKVHDTSFNLGYLKIELNGLFNCIDRNGNLCYSQWFSSLVQVDKKYSVVSLNGKYNVIRNDDTLMFDQWSDSKVTIRELSLTLDYYKVWYNGKSNYLDREKEIFLLPEWYKDTILCDCRDGIFIVVEEKGLKNIYSVSTSSFLFEEWVDDVVMMPDMAFEYCGICCIKKKDQYLLYKTDGSLLTNDTFDSVSYFENGFAGVGKNGKKNYISTEGTILSPQWLDEIGPFKENGYAKVRINKQLNVINKEGKLLIDNDTINVRSIEFDYNLYHYDDKFKSSYCKINIVDNQGIETEKYMFLESGAIYDSVEEISNVYNTKYGDNRPATPKVVILPSLKPKLRKDENNNWIMVK